MTLDAIQNNKPRKISSESGGGEEGGCDDTAVNAER